MFWYTNNNKNLPCCNVLTEFKLNTNESRLQMYDQAKLGNSF